MNPTVSIQQWLSKGWRLFWRQPLVFGLAAVFYFTVIFGTGAFYENKQVFVLSYFLLNGPLLVGFYALYFQQIRGEAPTFSAFFEGFRVFLPTVLANFCLFVILILGYTFFILPGFILEALFLFTYPLILDKRLGFWEAMMTSQRAVRKYVFEFSGYILLKWILYLAGLLFLGIGILVVFPWFSGSVAVAYSDIFGLEEKPAAVG